MVSNDCNRRIVGKQVIQQSIITLLTAICWLIASLPVAAAGSSGTPTIMIIMQEKVAGVFGTTGFEQPNQAELTMMEKFSELNFKVVDPSTVKRNLDRAQGLRFLEGDDAAAAVHGLQHGAKISVIGSVISKPSGGKLYGTRMQTIQATLTARVIRNDDARVIATGSASATQAHIDEVQGGVIAIEKAAGELAEQLGDKILANLDTGSKDVTTQITGLVSFRHLDFVMRYFENDVDGIDKVHLNNFSEGVAELVLEYEGEPRILARQIAAKKFKGFRLEPTNVSANRIDLKAILQK